MKRYILALDQGTTSCRSILFDKKGNICSMAQKEFRQIYPQPGWVEHDPMEIWSTQLAVAVEAISKIGASMQEIAGIGITNQRETTIVWDKRTGVPIYNGIVWQCRRTSDMVDQLVADGYGEMLRQKTGLVPDAYFSATKLKWILEHVKGAKERAQKGELLFGTVDTWLIWKLTGGKTFVTDYTNASRTMLFNIHTLQWDEEILSILDIPKKMLAEVKPSSCLYGVTNCGGLEEGIPISGAAGDQQAALFGQCCFQKGEGKNTYGTGCFLLMNTGYEPVDSKHGLITTIAAGLDNHVEYALEGSVFVAGAAVQWLRDELKIVTKASETEEIAQSVPNTDGVYVVPAFTGLGAPYWDQYARGAIIGMTRGFNRAHLVRAVLEGIDYQVSDIIQAMEQDCHTKMKTLKVDGGASQNNFLMQFQADILDCEVQRPSCVETTALGAAYLAGLAVGFWKNKEEVRANWAIDRIFSSRMEEAVRSQLLEGWREAVKRVRT
ncbi:MAG: glycerol kinase GlpK [Lachnospiraceae bacterium]